ncbi:MAG TPA: metallophosphoesterase family protein [Candidatus Angelobacter sp.]|jgi:putative phosphoesterase|nr:metallophosphoesterase family protein [Candidatus Angelobacter sp.]
MRIAIVSDIHGNLTALEAVIADLRTQAPDLVLQGGDLPYGGSNAAEVMDRVAELGWPGVVGNTDEVLWKTDGIKRMLTEAPKLSSLLKMIEECAVATRDLIGEPRMKQLQSLPMELRQGELVLLHAAPGDLWKAPTDPADDAALESVYGSLGAKTVVYGHIHRPFIREFSNFTVSNSGSVGMPYDGDPRACYLLLTDDRPEIRRVEYDIESEIKSLLASNYPHKEWLAEVRRRGAYVPPTL